MKKTDVRRGMSTVTTPVLTDSHNSTMLSNPTASGYPCPPPYFYTSKETAGAICNFNTLRSEGKQIRF